MSCPCADRKKEAGLRVFVLGAGGQLGVDLVSELRRRSHEVSAYGRRDLDITDASEIDREFAAHAPQWVINSAAYNLVDVAEKEPELAMRVNGLAVRSLARASQKAGATFVQFSTDHVFDGTQEEPYVETDPPTPPSAYGISKLAGELYAQAYCEKLYVVRVAGVFGPAGRTTSRGNFPELILRKARQDAPLRVVDDFFATPTYAPALAARSVDLLEREAPYGIYHLGGAVTISWYAWAMKVLDSAGLRVEIQPTNRREYVTAARRPRHAGLSNAKIEALGIPPMPTLDEALDDYLKQREKLRQTS